MDFWKAILGLARRPYVGPLVLVVSVALAGLAFLITPTRYVSSTTLVLTTPPSGGVYSQDPTRPVGLSNPLLEFGDGLKTTTGILIQVLNTPGTREQLGAPVDGPITVTVDTGRSDPTLLGVDGPFLFIQADGTSPEEVTAVVLRAQQRARDELASRQAQLGAPPSTFIQVVDVVAASEPRALVGGRWQAAAITLVAGVLFGMGGAYGAQRILAARRLTSTEDAADVSAAQASATGQHPPLAFPGDIPAAPSRAADDDARTATRR